MLRSTVLSADAYFCWLCGAQLDGKDPYRHYRVLEANGSNKDCFNQLFAGVPMPDDRDDEDEWDRWDPMGNMQDDEEQ